jgi:4-hydroxybenzoate polyprenyltransferase
MRRHKAAIFARFPTLPAFIAVARLDRPIGIYLLLWPTLWALWFAAGGWPGWHLLLVFTLGAIITRSAGCVVNDIVDREFDGEVRRTRGRPLAQGQLKVEEAFIFMLFLSFIALLLVLSTNWLTVLLAVLAAVVAAIYPFMKRYTYLPQVVLGLAFSMGIPMAFAATSNEIPKLAWLLVVANLVWTVAYDTEYAMVDRDDDIKLGLKSSAILFAELDTVIIGILQLLFLGIMLLVAYQTQMHGAFYFAMGVAATLLYHQQTLIQARQRDACFAAFLHWVGLAIFCGIAMDFMLYT